MEISVRFLYGLLSYSQLLVFSTVETGDSSFGRHVQQVNGSSIRSWWIHHHYWSMATCLIILTLPVDSRAYQEFLKSFLWWSCYQVSVSGRSWGWKGGWESSRRATAV